LRPQPTHTQAREGREAPRSSPSARRQCTAARAARVEPDPDCSLASRWRWSGPRGEDPIHGSSGARRRAFLGRVLPLPEAARREPRHLHVQVGNGTTLLSISFLPLLFPERRPHQPRMMRAVEQGRHGVLQRRVQERADGGGRGGGEEEEGQGGDTWGHVRKGSGRPTGARQGPGRVHLGPVTVGSLLFLYQST
jgi:hypothetical protein